jgi:hypothetical protein
MIFFLRDNGLLETKEYYITAEMVQKFLFWGGIDVISILVANQAS